ncbi:transporter, major facilitator family protein [Lentilactobacillus kisonensis DSM 19906 = JCM 15041]|uniref:Transporter, major facilitator family protein n=3 Tax=Lentilactobacillus kisonensis TaxID=481722 RepID=H1LC83_9LACO|nr:transporter, major facilitator family protein [Lentilactobacillus kisonensis F0435]KRL22689.1 transporter, major facilitator family protein [Lentilactobacillus kisonensis DSM 19906 = JCM 15041]
MTASTKPHNHPLLAISAIAAMTFLGILIETSMNVTFPTLMNQFNVSLSTVQWVTTGYLLTVALLMLVSAFLKRRFKNKQLFIWAVMLFIIGDVTCALASTYWVLLGGRLIQAGCVGISAPLMTNIILELVPRNKLGTYMGFANLILIVAPALGPTFGGAVVSLASWRMIFWITLPIAIIFLILGMIAIEQYTPTEKYPFDWLRFGLLSVTMVMLLVAMNALTLPNGIQRFGSDIMITAVALTLFIWRSKYSHRELFNLTVFKRPAFVYSFLPYVLLQFSNLGINFMLPNYVQMVNGATAFIGGIILFPGSVLNASGQPFYGVMLDRYGGKLPLYMGNTFYFVIMVCFMIFARQLSVLWVTIFYAIYAGGRAMAFGNTMTYGLKNLSQREQNDANALYGTGQQIAGSIGTTVMAVFMTMFKSPHVAASQAVVSGTQLAFTLLAVIGLLNYWLYRQLFKATVKK